MEIKVLKNILESNDEAASENRSFFSGHKIASVNIMSSPGSGKTELLDKTIGMLSGELGMAVVEGDIRTTMDAERLGRHDIQIVQINTEPFGGDCHLEAAMIRSAAEQMDLGSVDLIFVENVGNLVCPAEFELGVDRNIVALSVTEGEDKPLKYPLMFRTCELCLITKIDLLKVLDFDIDRAVKNIREINPKMQILHLSAKTSEGMESWIEYLNKLVSEKK